MSTPNDVDRTITAKIAERYGISTPAAAAMWVDVQAHGTESPYVREVLVIALPEIYRMFADAWRPVIRAHVQALRTAARYVAGVTRATRADFELVDGGDIDG